MFEVRKTKLVDGNWEECDNQFGEAGKLEEWAIYVNGYNGLPEYLMGDFRTREAATDYIDKMIERIYRREEICMTCGMKTCECGYKILDEDVIRNAVSTIVAKEWAEDALIEFIRDGFAVADWTREQLINELILNPDYLSHAEDLGAIEKAGGNMLRDVKINLIKLGSHKDMLTFQNSRDKETFLRGAFFVRGKEFKIKEVKGRDNSFVISFERDNKAQE